MTPKTPRLTSSEMVRAIEKMGFTLRRQSGSHMIFKDAAGKRVTIPYHAGRTLHAKVVASILKDVGLSVDDLRWTNE